MCAWAKQALHDLLQAAKGDSASGMCLQVIVFSDNVWALEAYARALNKPFIYGKTSHAERTQILSAFKRGINDTNTVFLSKVRGRERSGRQLAWCMAHWTF